MSTYLILPDIHNKVDIAQSIIDNVAHDYIIQTGDLWDDFNDNEIDAANVAKWVKKQLDNPNYIQLIGNHCAAIMWRETGCRDCSGFTNAKADASHKILKARHWDKFLPFFYIKEGNWLISHSGIDKSLIEPDILSDIDKLKADFAQAIESLKRDKYHKYFGAGYDRGGRQSKGGITWIDFSSINPVPQYNQIVGHTPLKVPGIKYRDKNNQYLKVREFNNGLVSKDNPNRMDNGDIVIGVDLHLHCYSLITDGVLTVHETPKEYFVEYEKEQSVRRNASLFSLYDSMIKEGKKGLR